MEILEVREIVSGRPVVMRRASDLVPYARNARVHSAEQVSQIAASVREWGWTMPILVDETGTVIAGHARLQAAKKLGMEEVPVVVAEGWSEAQKKAYVLADNKLTENGGWDSEILKLELEELTGLDFDLSLTGFDVDELASLLADKTEGLTDPDEIPEEPEEPVSKPGDVWVLGKHRLRCGDSTSADDVAALLVGVQPHLMVTDPPYGVSYDPEWRNRAKRSDGSVIGGKALGRVQNDDRVDWSEAFTLFPGDVCYVWMPAGPLSVTFHDALKKAGFEPRTMIIWAKNQHVIGRGHYHVQHEPCWYAVRKGKTAHWVGDRKQTTLWQIDKPRKSETGHSTQKPVECMKRPIENNSSPGQAVYEPFSGSGTTIIAAEMAGRCCYAMELHPPYVDVAVKRWQNFTGERAVLESTGEPFHSEESD